MAKAILGLLSIIGLAGAIYPEGHWDHATKVTSKAHLDQLVDANVNGDSTLFVRWIASEG